ncbi:MAG: PUA domain-containing protein, partial [Spirulinaceae cyanobacterium]
PQPRSEKARKRWIAHGLVPIGKLYLDSGAVKAICQGGKSLLAPGITQVEGDFQASEAVQLINGQNQEIARGIVNYSSAEIQLIKGHRSEEIPEILGYVGAETVIHRDNLVLG